MSGGRRLRLFSDGVHSKGGVAMVCVVTLVIPADPFPRGSRL